MASNQIMNLIISQGRRFIEKALTWGKKDTPISALFDNYEFLEKCYNGMKTQNTSNSPKYLTTNVLHLSNKSQKAITNMKQSNKANWAISKFKNVKLRIKNDNKIK